MSDDPASKVDSAQAWSEFCELLKKAGDTILRDGLARSSFDRAEGHRYLLRLLRAGSQSFGELTGPLHPVFRAMPELVKMGLDNPDNYYLGASISGKYTYRIRGRRGSIHYMSFAAQNQNFAAKDRITGGAGHLNDAEIAVRAGRQLRDPREPEAAAGQLAAARARHEPGPAAPDLPAPREVKCRSPSRSSVSTRRAPRRRSTRPACRAS